MSGAKKKTRDISHGRSKKAKKSRVLRKDQEMELENMLVSGEEILLRAKVHWAIYWRSIAVLCVASFLLFYIQPLGMLLGVAGVLMFCIAILTQHFLLLVVTNKRVLARYGLLQMDVVDVRLSKVESIDLERMLLGHLLGYANVVIAGTGQRIIRIPYISNGEVFRRFYNEMVLAEEGNEDAEIEIGKIKEEVEDAEKQQTEPRNKL
ncbi:MAG: PH domain-containing protein [Alphaproteobacteria bacterium]